MKTKHKIISLLLAIVVTFSLIACEGETTTEYIKKDLVDSVKNCDLTSGVLTVNTQGSTYGFDATVKISGNQTFDSDFYFMTYLIDENIFAQQKKAGAAYLRNLNVYTIFFDGESKFSLLPVTTSNYELEINNYLLGSDDKIELLYSQEEVGYAIKGFLGNFVSVSDNFIQRLAYLPENLKGLIKNAYALNNGMATEVYNGYRLSVDVIEILKECLLKFVSIGKAIDNNSSITVEGLYNSQEFNDLFKPILTSTDGKIVNQALLYLNGYFESKNVGISFDIPTPRENENAYDYLNRFISTKVMGLTIASLRINDLTDMLGGIGDSWEAYFSKIRADVLDMVKQFTDALKFVYFFDGNMVMTRISVDFNIKKNFISPDFAYESVHVKLDYRPQPILKSDLKIIPDLAE